MHIFFTTILRSNSSFHKFLNHFSFHSQHPSLIFPSLSPSFSVSHLEEGKMAGSKTIWFFAALSISMLLSWTNPRGKPQILLSLTSLLFQFFYTISFFFQWRDLRLKVQFLPWDLSTGRVHYKALHNCLPLFLIEMSLQLSSAFSSATASLRHYIPVCPFFLILLGFLHNGSSLF